MNTFPKDGLFMNMKMNTTENFQIQMPASYGPVQRCYPLKRKNPVFLLPSTYLQKQNECGIIDYP